MELPEILAELAAYVSDDPAKAKEVARALREKTRAETDPLHEHTETLNGIAQVLLNAGAGRKTGESTKALADKQAEIDRLTEALDTATEAAASAEKKPNELQADFDKRRLKLEEKATKLEADLKAERDGRTQDRVGYAAAEPLRHLQGAVDPDYLAEVIAPRLQRRVRPAATGTGVEYLDEHETPYDGDVKAQAKALADDTLKAVPDKYRMRQMNAGGGSSGGGQDGGPIRTQLDEEKVESGRYRL